MPDRRGRIGSAEATFVILAFEGPDRYASVGGLGTRVAELGRTMAGSGYETHLLFVGDPGAPGTEVARDRLVLHRWCQWISQHHPGGAYDGEEAKLADFNESVPCFVVDQVVRPALAAGRLIVVMAEEWHTAEALCRLSDLLERSGLRSRVVLLWNANSPAGFHRVDWARLSRAATISTVSRYMKHLMWGHGVNPLVVPNGIPERLLYWVDPVQARQLRRRLGRSLVLTKVGRWEPDKQWMMAVEAVAALCRRGAAPVLVAVGRSGSQEDEVLARARSLGLRVGEVVVQRSSLEAFTEAVEGAMPAEVINVRSALPLPVLRVLYRASDVVLANSGCEPFGLVGLEAMASGAVVITGNAGEDYALHLENAVVLETEDPGELAWYVCLLQEHPSVAERLAEAGRRTARRFLWERVLNNLVTKIEFLAARQGLLETAPLPVRPVTSLTGTL